MALMTDAYLLQLVWVALIVIAAVIFAINAIMRYVKRVSEKKECCGCELADKCSSAKSDVCGRRSSGCSGGGSCKK